MRALSPCLLSVLFLGCVTIGAGCASHRLPIETPASWHASGFHPTMPDKPFADYKNIFKYIAACEGLPNDGQTILGIAADSTIERRFPESIGTLIVIRAEYYGQFPMGGIRGAQGNGRYYAFQKLDKGWRLVGIFHGNRLRWECVGDRVQVFAHWHMSAVESDPTIYTWQRGCFE